MHVCVYACIHVCTYEVCTYVCMDYACIYVCFCIFAQTQHAHVHVCVLMCMYKCILKHMQVSPSGDTKTLFIEDNKEWLNLHNMLIPLKDEPRFLWASERSVCVCACKHACVCVCVLSVCVCVHVCVCVCVYIYIYTHTHTYINRYTNILCTHRASSTCTCTTTQAR